MPAAGDRINKRKDGLFQGMYTAQTPDGPKRKYVYGRKKKDVERRLAEAMGDAARGIVFDAGTLTVGQWLDSWLSDGLKPLVDADKMTYSTYKRYAGIVGKHLKRALGHRKLKDLTRAEVRKLYAAKSETLSPRSVDYIHITLQKALSQAVRDDLIPRNVAAGERPHSTRHASPDRVKAISPAQVRALLDAARGTRNEALYVVALHTTAAPGQRTLGRSSGISPPLGDALAFVPDADRERSSRCTVGDIRRASVASRSPALPPPRPRSRAGVLGGVTAGAAVLSCGV